VGASFWHRRLSKLDFPLPLRPIIAIRVTIIDLGGKFLKAGFIGKRQLKVFDLNRTMYHESSLKYGTESNKFHNSLELRNMISTQCWVTLEELFHDAFETL
jgi:hypothetical protein